MPCRRVEPAAYRCAPSGSSPCFAHRGSGNNVCRPAAPLWRFAHAARARGRLPVQRERTACCEGQAPPHPRALYAPRAHPPQRRCPCGATHGSWTGWRSPSSRCFSRSVRVCGICTLFGLRGGATWSVREGRSPPRNQRPPLPPMPHPPPSCLRRALLLTPPLLHRRPPSFVAPRRVWFEGASQLELLYDVPSMLRQLETVEPGAGRAYLQWLAQARAALEVRRPAWVRAALPLHGAYLPAVAGAGARRARGEAPCLGACCPPSPRGLPTCSGWRRRAPRSR